MPLCCRVESVLGKVLLCVSLAPAVCEGVGIWHMLPRWESVPDKIVRKGCATKTFTHRSPSQQTLCGGAAAHGLRLRGGFDVIASGQNDFVREVMEVPAERVGIIIGRQGGTIREIGRQSGVKLWVDQKTNLPGMLRILANNNVSLSPASLSA